MLDTFWSTECPLPLKFPYDCISQVHFLKTGTNAIGRKAPKSSDTDGQAEAQPDIQLSGLSIEQHHAEIIVRVVVFLWETDCA